MEVPYKVWGSRVFPVLQHDPEAEFTWEHQEVESRSMQPSAVRWHTHLGGYGDTCMLRVGGDHLSFSVKPSLGGKPHCLCAMWRIQAGFRDPGHLVP